MRRVSWEATTPPVDAADPPAPTPVAAAGSSVVEVCAPVLAAYAAKKTCIDADTSSCDAGAGACSSRKRNGDGNAGSIVQKCCSQWCVLRKQKNKIRVVGARRNSDLFPDLRIARIKSPIWGYGDEAQLMSNNTVSYSLHALGSIMDAVANGASDAAAAAAAANSNIDLSMLMGGSEAGSAAFSSSFANGVYLNSLLEAWQKDPRALWSSFAMIIVSLTLPLSSR